MSGNVGWWKTKRSLLCSTCHHGCYVVNILALDISEMMSLNPSLVSIKSSLHHCLLRIPSHFAHAVSGSRDTACFVWETLAQNPPSGPITSESRAWVRSSWPRINIWGEEDGKVGKVETSKLEVKYFIISRD